MLKCNDDNSSGRLYKNGLCVQGERIIFKKINRQQVHYEKSQQQQQQQGPVVVKQHHYPARRTERKTLHLNVVDGFHGELLKTLRKGTSVEVEDLKRLLLVKKNEEDQQLRRKYSSVYYEFFGVHYEHLKSHIRIE